MLVKLKNTGLSTRIFHDAKGKQHVSRVGAEIEIDVHERIAKRFERGQAKGDPLEIEYVGERPSAHPSETDVKQPGMGSQQQATALQNATLPLTRRELEGSMPKSPVLAEEIPPERTHDPVLANAERQAQDPALEPEPPKEPTTPAELVAYIEAGGVSEADQLRLAKEVLPSGTLPQRLKPAQIMAALRRATRD